MALMNLKERSQGKRKLPKEILTGDIERFCSLLKVMSNPNRLKILVYLLDGESSVGEMETVLAIKQPNLSHVQDNSQLRIPLLLPVSSPPAPAAAALHHNTTPQPKENSHSNLTI